MEDAEQDRLGGVDEKACPRHQGRRAGDDGEAAGEGHAIEPARMGQRQRNADQAEKRARDQMRQRAGRRREGQRRRDQAEMGEVPDQVIDDHAGERGAARDVDRGDAPELGRSVRLRAQRHRPRPAGDLIADRSSGAIRLRAVPEAPPKTRRA